ncbi:hypothetical protein HYX70_03625 [Candidatus Saccharibacteria bacterium]|nr:hypothetical protein [Candidatus Saccharibacteria bacterium]
MYSRGTRYLFLVLSAALGLLALSGRALAASETVNNKLVDTSSSVSRNNNSSNSVLAQSSESSSVYSSSIITAGSKDEGSTGSGTGYSAGTTTGGDNELPTKNSDTLTNTPGGTIANTVLAAGERIQAGDSQLSKSAVEQIAHSSSYHAIAPSTAPSQQDGARLTPAQLPVPAKSPIQNRADLGYTLGALAQLLSNTTIGYSWPDFIAIASLTNTANIDWTAIIIAVLALLALLATSELIVRWRKKGFVHAARADLSYQNISTSKLVGGLLKSNSRSASSHFIAQFQSSLQNQKSKIMCNTNLIGGAL